MVSNKDDLFRKKARDHASSPERLDQLLQIVSPKNWLPLIAMGTVVAAGVTWSVLGKVPITSSGQGVLIYPSKVTDLQSPLSGQVSTLRIKVGELVKKGDVLATIDQPELKQQLQLQRAKLAELEAQNSNANSLQGQSSDLALKAIAQQRESLQERLQQAQSFNPIIRDKSLNTLKVERENLEQRLRVAQELIPTLDKRLKQRRELKEQGAIPADLLLEAEQTYSDNIQKIGSINSELESLKLKQVAAEKEYRDNISQIKDFETQIQALKGKEKELAVQDFQSSNIRVNQIQEIKRTINELEAKTKGNSSIISQHTGRVLELTSSTGQVVTPGSRLATIQAQEEKAKIVSISFFPVAEGKKIREGMEVQVTPTTVKREEFGGIKGKVVKVSSFPITKEGAASLVGNPEIIQSIIAQGPHIQVTTELEVDATTVSKYKWSSSKGPNLTISPGTVTSSRVTIEERAPISFVFPILKEMTGL
ncbi:NHLP bacteriocin system secretion protein [Calothrix sp. PCC 6303]|uniref:NHLP bacteriocin system secretion protein n=1 Tax=Calothrix sp. PCC 6303 TaxID=1170562 RepID=UPI0002A052D7|nr:NHLP bacteriocin system secretion protein [Calothrix sp. PCC 6303]AFZ03320.1 NHPM bacteriocin system secretion protein [Calothrix sp. PCC 6303]